MPIHLALNKILPNTKAFIHISTVKAGLNQLSTRENITLPLNAQWPKSLSLPSLLVEFFQFLFTLSLTLPIIDLKSNCQKTSKDFGTGPVTSFNQRPDT